MKHWSRDDLKDQVEAASYKLKEPRGHLDQEAYREVGERRREAAARILPADPVEHGCTAANSRRFRVGSSFERR